MKRFLIILLAIGLVLTGCKKNNKPASNTDPSVSSTNKASESTSDITNEPTQDITSAPVIEINEKVASEMRYMVLSDSTPQRLIEFVQNNINDVSPDEADKLLLILESVQSAWLGYYKSSVNFNSKDITGMGTELLTEIEKNGFKLITIDNVKVPAINYDIYLNSGSFLSDWFTQYIEIANIESNKPAVCNGNLNISYEELENRILIASEFIKKYPQAIRINEVISCYEDYLFTYFYGYEPEPVFNTNTGKATKEHIERYKEFVKKNAGTVVSEYVTEYINLIEKGDYSLTEEIMNFLEETFSKLNDKRIYVEKDIGRQIMAERMEKLLPERTGFFWRCFGFAEYGHDTVLSSIRIEDGNPVYVVTGQVDDASGGEIPKEHLLIYLQYRIESNILKQSKEAPLMMDSDFDNIELIRYPFVVGHKWNQSPIDGNGKLYSIETEIISATKEGEESVYEVEYRDMSNGKVESRLIQVGKGTIGFTKLYDDNENDPFLIGYTIYEEQSGYVNHE